MGKLEEALQEKIELLLEEKDELESSLQRVGSQLELCQGLLSGEIEGFLETEPKKKRGRPKKTAAKSPAKKRGRPRKKVAPEIEEARQQEYDAAKNSLPDGTTGTTVEEQKRAIRRFNPAPRGPEAHHGITIGSTKGKPGPPEEVATGHSTISMEDGLAKEE